MIICIESRKGDALLSGKSRSLRELKTEIRAAEALRDPEYDNFIPLLCRMYGWETEPYSETVIPDLTYDRDTGLIF